MPKKQSDPTSSHFFHSLHDYQQKKVGKLFKGARVAATLLCAAAIGLGALWYLKSSWAALIFGILFLVIGLGLLILTFVLADKVSTFNKIASSAINAYDRMAGDENTVDTETTTVNPKTTETDPVQQRLENF